MDKLYVERSGGRWVGYALSEGRRVFLRIPTARAEVMRWAHARGFRVVWVSPADEVEFS